ncbi:DUF1217 domain-containing protein [Citreimonas sp.]|uniref:DUF1217 domain-containing protein n=1 Tax=Citreimonas sp. TaxID=3036715 RepID=UPI0035C7DD25
MSFQPIVVGSGLVGWQFLQSTQDRQKEVFNASPLLKRDTDYFAQNIGSIKTAEDLVSDRRLLRVALGAFGLQDDIDSKFFIRRILEDGTTERTALANRLADERYKAFSKAFGFDNPFGPKTSSVGFAQDIVAKFRQQSFEVAVGESDQSLRLALNFKRGLTEIHESGSSENAQWFRLMGTPPMRTVLEKALNLPSSFGQLDIDVQKDVFQEKARARFGTDKISEMLEPDVMKKVVQTYLLQEQIGQFQTSNSGQIALTLLQSSRR